MRYSTNCLSIKNILIVVALALSCCFLSLSYHCIVRADDGLFNAKADYYLPNNQLEHKALTSPIDVYSDDTVTAIVGDNQTLTIYYDGDYSEIDNFTAIKQVKKLDDQTLLVLDSGNIYSISLSNQTTKTLLPNVEGCNYFDINENYLITAFNTKAIIYENNDGVFSKIENSDFTVIKDYPIAINSNNEIFFVNTNGLNKCVATDTENPVHLSNDLPSVIIANSQFVYRVAVDGSAPTLLTVGGLDENYDLGNLKTPTGIAFKGANLLVTDTALNAVQEFSVNDDKLDFTGFAIASGQSAYNRISANTIEIEKTNNKIAILDTDKLLIVSNQNQNPYARENFDNYLKEDTDGFNGVMPETIALGENTVLLSYNHKTWNSYLKLININEHSLSSNISVLDYAVEDICYQSGNYYVLLTGKPLPDTNTTYVYKIEEGQTTLSSLVFSTTDFYARSIAVDVFDNVYLADSSGNIKKFGASDYSLATDIGTRAGLKKMLTDLGGVLFTLSNDGLSRYTQSEFIDVELTLPDSLDQINSFALNFEPDAVCFTINNKEYVCASDTLGNYSLQDVEVSQTEFATTKNTAQIDEFKYVTVNENANVYKVLRERNGNKFAYIERTDKDAVYAFICQTDLGNGISVSVLASQDQIVLVNTSEHSTPTALGGTDAPQTVFVTTDVNAYYFPIINKIDKGDGDYISYLNFSLTDQNGESRIKKGCSINPLNIVEFLTREKDGEPTPIYYYFANFEIDGVTHSGYIPVSFTVPVLAKDFAWAEYSIETVNKTDVFATNTLDGNAIYTLTNGQKVRVLEKQDGVIKIAISVLNDEWIEGYISANAIQDNAKTAFRNIVLIVIVSTSILSTSLFLILRKRKI